MNRNSLLPSIEDLKQQAKRLRSELEAISHSKALELIAHQHGYKDWNTLHAAAGNRGPQCPVVLGQRVRGTYLGQRFEGAVSGVQVLEYGERFRVRIVFDEAVDVVRFEGLSNLRKRVSCVIGTNGKTAEKTSDGLPHMVLTLPGKPQVAA